MRGLQREATRLLRAGQLPNPLAGRWSHMHVMGFGHVKFQQKRTLNVRPRLVVRCGLPCVHKVKSLLGRNQGFT